MVSEEKIRKTISIEKVLLKRSQQSAKNDNRTFSNLVTVLLEKHLKQKA